MLNQLIQDSTRWLSTLFILMTGLSLSIPLLAQNKPDLTQPVIIVPEKISGVKTFTAEHVIEKILATPELVVIDARIKADREYGYLEDSISLPDIETNCKTLAAHITNKNTALLFYCNGVQCGRSVVSIKIARSCGYTNISWFKGGFAEWKQKGYPYVRN